MFSIYRISILVSGILWLSGFLSMNQNCFKIYSSLGKAFKKGLALEIVPRLLFNLIPKSMTTKQIYNLLKDVSEGYVTPERALTQLCKDDKQTKPKMGNIEACFQEAAMDHMFNELNDFEQGI